MTTLERWRHNLPVKKSEYWSELFKATRFLVVCLVALVAICLTSLWGQDRHTQPTTVAVAKTPAPQAFSRTVDRPQIVVFHQDNAAAAFEQQRRAGHLPPMDVVYVWKGLQTNMQWQPPGIDQEFFQAVPAGPYQAGPGPKQTRPQAAHQLTSPLIWIRGTPHYWVGYDPSHLGNFIAWVARNALDQREPAANADVAVEFGSTQPLAADDPVPASQGATPTPAAAAGSEHEGMILRGYDLSGVAIVITVDELADVDHSARRSAAEAADSCLKQLVASVFGDRVHAEVVCKVNRPNLFDAIRRTSGKVYKPIALHVMIPEMIQGFVKNMILNQMQGLVKRHINDGIQKIQLADVEIYTQRYDGGIYEKMLAVLQKQPEEPVPEDGELPDDVMKHGIVAIIVERLKILRALKRLFWPDKPLEVT